MSRDTSNGPVETSGRTRRTDSAAGSQAMPAPSAGLVRYAWFTVAATVVLICIGGLVTSHGAGMAVPDWPNTYGYNLFLFPISKWVGGILYEHTHRLMAALVGLLTAGLAAWLWIAETQGRVRAVGVSLMVVAVGLLGFRAMPVYLTLAALALPAMVWGLYRFAREPSGLRWLGVTALAAVILQGVLGGLRVAWLKDEIGVFHGMLAQSFLVLTGTIALLGTRWWREPEHPSSPRVVRRMLLFATLLVLVQLGLGASMRHRHAGLAVPDFPLAYGRVWPPTDDASIRRYNQQRLEVVAVQPLERADVLLHMTHRLGAGAVVGAVLLAFFTSRRHLEPGHVLRRGTAAWLALVLVQFALGALTVWTNKAADIATAHVAVGSLILLGGGLLCAVAWRRPVPLAPALVLGDPGAPVGCAPNAPLPAATL